jgi:glucose/arabinose dehydrogenase
VLLAALLVIAACSGDDDDTAGDPTPTATPGPTHEPTVEPTEDPTPEPTADELTPEPTQDPTEDPTPEPADDGTVAVDLVFEGGAVSVADDRIDIDAGDTVVINATSDVAEEIHVHGYDLFVDLEPGVAGSISFAADIPGIFEVEFERTATFAFELEVG